MIGRSRFILLYYQCCWPCSSSLVRFADNMMISSYSSCLSLHYHRSNSSLPFQTLQSALLLLLAIILSYSDCFRYCFLIDVDRWCLVSNCCFFPRFSDRTRSLHLCVWMAELLWQCYVPYHSWFTERLVSFDFFCSPLISHSDLIPFHRV